MSPGLLVACACCLVLQGHGDELCLADCNFPAQAIAEKAQGHTRILYELSQALQGSGAESGSDSVRVTDTACPLLRCAVLHVQAPTTSLC